MHFYDFSGWRLYETGLCAAAVQLQAAYTVHSTHAGIQHPCVLHVYMTSHTISSTKSRFCKPRLLFESGLCVGMQFQKCDFHSRAAFIQDFTVFSLLSWIMDVANLQQRCSSDRTMRAKKGVPAQWYGSGWKYKKKPYSKKELQAELWCCQRANDCQQSLIA